MVDREQVIRRYGAANLSFFYIGVDCLGLVLPRQVVYTCPFVCIILTPYSTKRLVPDNVSHATQLSGSD